MDIRIPAPVEEIIDKLNMQGYEAYVVGGCVRDMLLGREPGDWDITTSALPRQVKQVFRRTVDTGIQHGTVTVMMGKAGYEVTTYRIDGEYLDGRHPDSVSFTPDLRSDLKRRDFTINAMAYNSREGIVDEFGGREDLAAGIIRCVGKAADRFSEDALRILRAVRFSAQLGFTIEEGTCGAIRSIAPNLVHVSKERIQAELTKLLLSGHPELMALVWEAGISSYVSEAFHSLCGDGRVLPAAPVTVPAVKHMRWAAFLRLGSPEKAVRVLRDLKLDNDTIYRVKTLVAWLGVPLGQEKAGLRRVMSQMEMSLFDDLLTLKLCLAFGEKGAGGIPASGGKLWGTGACSGAGERGPEEQLGAGKREPEPEEQLGAGKKQPEAQLGAGKKQPGPETEPGAGKKQPEAQPGAGKKQPEAQPGAVERRPEPGMIPETPEVLAHIRSLTEEIRGDGDCISLKALAVGGRDIIEAGVKPGKEVGDCLGRLLDLVLEKPSRNTKEYLLQHLK